jgi:hypothetical protein
MGVRKMHFSQNFDLICFDMIVFFKYKIYTKRQDFKPFVFNNLSPYYDIKDTEKLVNGVRKIFFKNISIPILNINEF